MLDARGYYRIYDLAGSNVQAEAVYFADHWRLVIMTLGDEPTETIIIEIPYRGLPGAEQATSRESIVRLLKERFETDFVTFAEVSPGNWV